jgi:hypothetical protein
MSPPNSRGVIIHTYVVYERVLKAKEAKEVSLFITHGIFSKGLDVFGKQAAAMSDHGRRDRGF